ncbi:predicted GPI-anchored protein 58 [Oryza brachyantha]|uniref:BLOC-1-related complex subunit 6 C-terminal helix domain-containing protein n=1 Tax=Oryza brachyantha TaxID=4533 RepID=J3MKW2_ORYBR|nr:predicted GPI-anchored protein 58 [Oryza brachyantha]XP_015694963.1 predicted GPI-anchored protein 58 [Oryza brachyantha]
MEDPAAASTPSPSPDPPAPPDNQSPSHSSPSAPSPAAAAPPGPGPRELAAAMEAVERDAAAIADSYASLFASLRVALSNVTSTSAENMDCLGDVVGRLQESALEASSKGNKYINSCLRLNEEMRGLESLAMQLKILRKNVDSLDLAVNQLLRLP